MTEGYYKINPEIRDFILKEAGEKPQLGCRKLSGLIRDKFGIEVSKSSISAILKAKGLNKPVGRRGRSPRVGAVRERPLQVSQINQSPDNGLSLLTAEEKPLLTKIEREISLAPSIIQDDKLPPAIQGESRQIQAVLVQEETSPAPLPGQGCWFLKAAELCLGGLQAFAAFLSSSLKEPAAELLAGNEALLYLSALDISMEEISARDTSWEEALAAITGRRHSAYDLKSHFESLKQVDAANLRIFVREALSEKEVLGLKFILEDGTYFFLDGAGRSIWAKNHIPLEFSQGLSKVRDYPANAVFQGNYPLILQASPGLTSPAPAFLNFISAFSGQKPAQAIRRIEFYDSQDKLIEYSDKIPLKRHYFILGVWPWQYPDRGMFAKEGLRQVSYMKGDKEVLTVITNLPEEEQGDQGVIDLYLERWPNLETGHQDFLDKIGHYFEIKNTPFSSENVQIKAPQDKDLSPELILDSWRMKLNAFCQRHFFPLKYNKAEHVLFKEHFYCLPGFVKDEEKFMEVIFSVPQGFQYLDDLAYACQRVNEADIRLYDGRKLRLRNGGESAFLERRF